MGEFDTKKFTKRWNELMFDVDYILSQMFLPAITASLLIIIFLIIINEELKFLILYCFPVSASSFNMMYKHPTLNHCVDDRLHAHQKPRRPSQSHTHFCSGLQREECLFKIPFKCGDGNIHLRQVHLYVWLPTELMKFSLIMLHFPFGFPFSSYNSRTKILIVYCIRHDTRE